MAADPPQPRLVKDINRSSEDLGSFPAQLTRIGGTIFFSAQDPAHGHELWKTDGTAAGTVLLKDIIPGSTGGLPYNLTAVGDRLFFVAKNQTGGTILWTSDGTTAGTQPALELLDGSFYATLRDFVGTGTRLFYTRDQGHFPAPLLYATDGTPAGTVILNPLDAQNSFVQRFYYPGKGLPLASGAMVFPANNGELWISDGSVQGTQRLAELPQGNGDGLQILGWVGDELIMSVPGEGTEAGSGLWKADLISPAATQLFGPPTSPGFRAFGEAASTGDTIFFMASDDASGAELWASDGTAAGTRLVKDLYPGSSSSFPGDFTAAAGRVFFTAEVGPQGPELWTSDGTPAGTRKLSPAGKRKLREPRLLTASGNGICFVADDAKGSFLWKSDGTLKGTVMLKQISGANASHGIDQLMPLANQLLFCGSDGRNGNELWTSNGTPRGTQMLANLATGTKDGYYPFDEIPMAFIKEDKVYFRADDGIRGEELWETDGTEKGTRLVRDLVPGKVGGEPRQIMEAGGSLLFEGYDPKSRDALWTSGGTKTSTRKVIDLRPDQYYSHIREITRFAGQEFFVAQQAETSELWVTNGTAASTAKLQPLGWPLEWPSFLTVLGGANGGLFFAASRDGEGSELWRSDGTAAGTALVKDLRPGPLGSSPSFLTAAGSRIFFRAFMGYPSGIQLWKTDGSADGTVQVSTAGSWASGADPYPMIPAGEDLYFFVDDGAHGNELWRSDGTPAGTAMVKDIHPTAGQRWEFGSEDRFAFAGDLLFFMADDGVHGEELWRSDGTAEGTTMVKDIFPGTGHSRPADMIVVGANIYFSADDGSSGREWWTSDGTAAGTQMVADLSPGSGGSDPGCPLLHENKLYFKATTPAYGSELWVIDGVQQRLAFPFSIDHGSLPYGFVELGGTALFHAGIPGVGQELHVLDLDRERPEVSRHSARQKAEHDISFAAAP